MLAARRRLCGPSGKSRNEILFFIPRIIAQSRNVSSSFLCPGFFTVICTLSNVMAYPGSVGKSTIKHITVTEKQLIKRLKEYVGIYVIYQFKYAYKYILLRQLVLYTAKIMLK
jgi:hypothetical protein